MARALGLALLLAACSSSDTARAPTGSPGDPVAVCTRAADVCQLDGARLGVCTAADPPGCQGKTPCFVCRSQH